jgi:hypothetical protein
MSRTFSVRAFKGTGDNRQALELLDLTVPDSGIGHTQAVVGVLSETVPVASFTDGGAAVGTYQLQGVIPAGSIILYSKIGPVTGFAGDVSATMTIGDGSGRRSLQHGDAVGLRDCCGWRRVRRAIGYEALDRRQSADAHGDDVVRFHSGCLEWRRKRHRRDLLHPTVVREP